MNLVNITVENISSFSKKQKKKPAGIVTDPCWLFCTLYDLRFGIVHTEGLHCHMADALFLRGTVT